MPRYDHLGYDREVALNDLEQQLRRHGIAYETWGFDGTKTIDDLRTELREGESALEVRDKLLVRKVQVVGVDVFADINGARHILREDRQEFVCDGTIKYRQLSTSLGEKMRFGETSREAMARALHEELGIDAAEECIRVGDTQHQLAQSTTYPGLISEKMLTLGAILLAPSQVRQEGYTECQPTKCTYFSWRLLPELTTGDSNDLIL